MDIRRTNYYQRPVDYVAPKFSKIDLAYLAGIIDGEGCFHIHQHKNCKIFTGILKIDNTDKALIDWLSQTFPGFSSARSRETRKKNFERDIYTWCCSCDRLLNLAECVLPYLKLKKKHCENMIAFRKTYKLPHGSHGVTDEVLAQRKELERISKNLNSRWHLHPLKNKPSALSPSS